MAPPASGVLSSWSPCGNHLAIEYDRSVFEEIRILVIDGYNKVSHGGLEVGGVLFGERDGAGIRIRAFRELRIQYKSGPSFTLSDKDELDLRELLRGPQTDPELSGLEPVGWWHSHTRSEIHLSSRDISLHERYFPNPWQIALVLKPHKWDPVRAAFFLRGGDGAMAGTPGSPELELAPPKRPRPDETPVVEEPVPQIVSVPAVIPEPVIRERKTIRWPAVFAVAALLAVAATVLTLLQMNRQDAPPDPRLHVRVADTNGQLLISWDGATHAVRQVRSARLEITDGEDAITVPLTPAQVRRGNVIYARNSRAVTVRLQVHPENGPVLDDIASFVGSAVQKPVAPPSLPVTETPQTKAERDAPQTTAERDGPLEAAVIRPKRFVLPRPTSRAAAESPVLTEAPQISGVESRTLSFAVAPAPRVPAPPAASPRVAEAPPQRRSGRVIWTGLLRRGQFLAIDGNHSSTGFLNGELPVVPVRIRVHPVDLTENGLRVYTADAALSGKVEPPGPQNGWNPTRFTVEPRIAGGLHVIEAPGPQNGWKRIVLQSTGRDESAVVIQWETR